MTDVTGWTIVVALFVGLPLWTISGHLGTIAKAISELRDMAARNRQ